MCTANQAKRDYVLSFVNIEDRIRLMEFTYWENSGSGAWYFLENDKCYETSSCE